MLIGAFMLIVNRSGLHTGGWGPKINKDSEGAVPKAEVQQVDNFFKKLIRPKNFKNVIND